MQSRDPLRKVLGNVRGGAFEVRWWDGLTECFGNGDPSFALVVQEPSVLLDLAGDTENGFVDSYVSGRPDVVGDIADVVSPGIRNQGLAGHGPLARLPATCRSALRRLSLHLQKENAQRHYDLGNEFFSLWLDDSLTYSCALYENPGYSLEDAQLRKIDHSLAKLDLHRGESLLDIGCGWGSAIIRAAQVHGVHVTGITLSREQAGWVRDEVVRLGLAGLCEVREENYLESARGAERFDRILSIGMVEHVGRAHLMDFAGSLAGLLRPGGRAMVHTITRPPGTRPLDDRAFSARIFPGGYIPSVREMVDCFDGSGLRLEGAENIGPNFALTLDAWSSRFEANVDRVREMFDEPFVRLWRLYLRGFSALFRERCLDVHQLVVTN